MGFLDNARVSKANDWGTIPAALNMKVGSDGVVRGLWGGVTELIGVHDSEETECEGSDGQRTTSVQHFTNFFANISPPLLCGLRCFSRGSVGQFAEKLLGTRDLQTGHAEFDRLYDLYAADSTLGLQLIRQVASILAEVHPHVPKLTISDQYAMVRVNHWTNDLNAARTAFEAVGRVALGLQTERARTVASWEPAFQSAWSSVASAWALNFDPKRATMEGTVRTLGVSASTDYEKDHLRTSIEITLPSAVPASFQLTRQDDGFIARRCRGQDIVVGNPAFDAMFVVKGEPEAQVRALLTPKACAWLVAAYTQLGGFVLVDRSFRVTSPDALLTARALQSFLELCFGAAESLMPQGNVAGPFR
jgi:hypothetical protein